jgi:hypothetical protein
MALIIGAAVSFLPGGVNAALWLVLDHSTGSPGELIHGVTGGNGAFGEEARGQELPLYLVPSGQDVNGPSDPALITLGFLTVDEQGNGSTTFLVPAAKAGSYRLILDCPTCAPFSGGQRMTGVGMFEIVAAPDTAMVTTSPRWLSLVGLLILLLALAWGARPSGLRGAVLH